MDVLIAGGHGQVARRLIRILARDGHTARGLIRNPDHAAHIEADGGVPVLCDLEHDEVTPHVGGADAIVFAAGAGPGSGAERKRTVDLGGAVKCVDAADALGVARFVIVSSIGAHDPEAGPEAMRPYLRAKAEADAWVSASGLDWTIVRPGSLEDGPGTGLVDASTVLGRRGTVPREDVALVLAETLQASGTIHLTFELFTGETPAREAVQALGR
ncbi:MAG TPA: SDR family oxidoreductase [Solirubrobacteraceae bacterium]|nr:SDR family oxidoreductase [Solirubrobacteraceae bacterium]